MLQRGDSVPHFDLTSVQGEAISYRTIWQHRNLVLIALPEAESEAALAYAASVTADVSAFDARNADCLITKDPVSGVPAPGFLIADRWGEIVHVAAAPEIAALPPVRELLDWLDYVQNRCPECEGEAR